MKDRATNKMKRGEVKFAQKDGLTATVWRDKRKVATLSTNTTPAMLPVKRRTAGGFKDVIIPSTILAYNRHMFGVDLADQHRSYYNMGRSGLKWWRYVAWFLLQTAMINSWILYKLCNRPHPRNRRLMSQIQYWPYKPPAYSVAWPQERMRRMLGQRVENSIGHHAHDNQWLQPVQGAPLQGPLFCCISPEACL